MLAEVVIRVRTPRYPVVEAAEAVRPALSKKSRRPSREIAGASSANSVLIFGPRLIGGPQEWLTVARLETQLSTPSEPGRFDAQ